MTHTYQYSILLMRIAQHKSDYYETILEHGSDILKAIKLQGQTKTAQDLGMSQAKLSTLSKLLEATHKTTRLYYITIDGTHCKVGITTHPRSRLSGWKGITSIETWVLSADTAKEAEAFIKLKYKCESFAEKFSVGGGNTIPYTTSNAPLEALFDGDVLTQADRLYLSSLEAI